MENHLEIRQAFAGWSCGTWWRELRERADGAAWRRRFRKVARDMGVPEGQLDGMNPGNVVLKRQKEKRGMGRLFKIGPLPVNT